jgi:hypothetical protein
VEKAAVIKDDSGIIEHQKRCEARTPVSASVEKANCHQM